MTHNDLIVIGNGFDLHHGVNSRYTDFGAYVKNADKPLHNIFEHYFTFEGNWANLEETLAHIDVNTLVEDASAFLVSYGSEQWRDSDNHAYQDEIASIVRALSTELRQAFCRWVFNLHIPRADEYRGRKLRINPEAIYLNFNYTPTLERLYGIPATYICYIHNRADNSDSALILGHCFDPSARGGLNDGVDLEAQDVRVTAGNQIIDDYFGRTFKPTAKVISDNSSFFAGLHGIRSITVIGHSLSAVDMPYFQEIARRIVLDDVAWLVTYYNSKCKDKFSSILSSLGVPTARQAIMHIDDLTET